MLYNGRKNFIKYIQSTTPIGAKQNDLWYNTSDQMIRTYNLGVWKVKGNIYSIINADFDADDTTAIINQSIHFTDNSIGNVVSWSWDFGDGITSTDQNPTHQYSSNGQYTVSLTVTDIHNNHSTKIKNNYIVVADKPTANFVVSTTAEHVNTDIQFTDTSTSHGTITSWQWDFGDGNTSTAQNPTHQYTSSGIYSISLIVTDEFDSDIIIKNNYIAIDIPPTANFAADKTTANVNENIQFTDQSTSYGTITSWQWDFGDGSTSNIQNPVHQYTASGDYTVSLTVTDEFGNDTLVRNNYITISLVLDANFTVDDTTATTSQSIQFTDQSTSSVGITSWQWDFGDGNTSTDQNPTHQYSSNGQYTVSLTITDIYSNQDTETKINYIIVANDPGASFVADDTSVIINQAVHFTDQSTSSGTISSWQWDFGDGNTSTAQNPTHQYSSNGQYTVSLTITDEFGSDIMIRNNYITVANLPVANFTANDTSAIINQSIIFTDQSTSSGTISSWQWDFGDGNTSTAQNPSHYYTANGTYTVSLTVTDEFGTDTETKNNYIIVADLPTADFAADDTTKVPYSDIHFTDTSISDGTITSWQWDFGDGNTSTDQNPTHYYTTNGIYSVSLTVTDEFGTSTETKNNYIDINDPPVADFSGPTVGHVHTDIQFTDQSTSSGTITSWQWDFGDGGTSTAQNPVHQYDSSGQYTIVLMVTDEYGDDVVIKDDYIAIDMAPTADFYADTETVYIGDPVQFTDASTSHGTITDWSWDFGDGTGSMEQNPTHQYTAPGTYTVSLTVTDEFDSDIEVKDNYITVEVNGTGYEYGYSMGGLYMDFNAGILEKYSTIDRITFPFDSGTATHVGNLSIAASTSGGFNSSNYGYAIVSNVPSNNFGTVPTIINRLTFPFNSGTATHVGNLYSGTVDPGGSCNSSNYGYMLGGHDYSGQSNNISYIGRVTFPFNSGNAVHVGNLACQTNVVGSCNSSNYGYSMGRSGLHGGTGSDIDRITFPFNSGTASHVGNLSRINVGTCGGCNSSNYGYCMGGADSNYNAFSNIDRITFPFNSGTASHVGNLSSNSGIENSGCNSSNYGYHRINNSVYRITFPFNSGTSVHVGNLTSRTYNTADSRSWCDGTDFVMLFY